MTSGGTQAHSTSTGDVIIVKFDAGTQVNLKFGSIAWVASQGNGELMGSFSAIYKHIWNPGILEFLTLRDAMQWCLSKGWKKVKFEGDATQVTNAFTLGRCSLAKSIGICNDLWLLQSSYHLCQVIFIGRKNITKAHQLAQREKVQNLYYFRYLSLHYKPPKKSTR
ncbi:uncharacterized protein LOC126687574 [Mercurialis annua]|uniref:uncharacterized protein LOC126687574 n=1 Tax=Mercurialis annua TaxID=3986 RepID=UPI00215F1642|nr:uncharacterized protein LOC126687574 [Mercurialis annua]